MGGRAVTCWETLAGHDESGAVGPEVEEELRQDVEREECVTREVVVCEADDDEEDGQHGEAQELDGLAAEGVDCCDGDPVSGNGSGAGEDQVANCVAVEDLVHVGSTGVSNC